MTRRLITLSLATALTTASAGCRLCGDRGWFTSTRRGDAPGILAGRSQPGEACCDPLSGLPVSGIPSGVGPPTTLIPGPAGLPTYPGTRPDELPYPQPTDLIPRPGVPLAPPSPAPADGGTSMLPAPKAGVSVKGGR